MLEPSLFQPEVGFFSPAPTYPSMVRGEIGTLTQTASCPVRGEIKQLSASCPVRGEIIVAPPDPPTNPLAVHLNQGRIAFKYGHPNPERIAYYEVYAGFASTGPFFPYPTGRFQGFFGTIFNFPLGTTAYFQLRAVGKNRLASSFVAVQRGIFQPIDGTLTVTAVTGSILRQNARFSILHPVTRLPVVFRVKNDTVI